MAGKLIEYKEQMLTIYAIAKIEGIAEPKLRIVYSKIGNIYDAVDYCKSNIRKKIEYAGAKLSLKAIAQQEELCCEMLSRNYKKTGDIDKAVELTKQTAREKFDYNGEKLTLTEIAKLEKICRITLKKYYDLIGNIYQAVDICKEKSTKRNKEKTENQVDENQGEILTVNKRVKRTPKTIEYKGEMLTLSKIAQNERITVAKLSKWFEQLKDINKAVFVTKYLQRQEQSVFLEQAEVNLYDLSILIGVKPMILINLLNDGINIDEIKNKYQNRESAEKIKLRNGQTLLEYCVKNKFDFSFFYRGVITYKMDVEEIFALCKKRKTDIQMEWIYKTYGESLNKLNTTTLQNVAIIYDLQKKKVSLEEALELCTIRKYARKNELDIEWGEALYSLIQTQKIIGLEFHSEIILNEAEKDFISKCELELLNLKRELQKESIFTHKEERTKGITHE